MELNITQEKQNPLFNRKEILGTIKADNPPKKQELAQELGNKFSAAPEAIRIVEIKGQYGIKEFNFKANIYESKKEKNEIELISKKEREKEKSAETSKEEAKTEETKEEVKPSETPEQEPKEAPQESQPEKEPKESTQSKEEKANPDEEPKQ